MPKVTFKTLNPNAQLFTELSIEGKYKWWEKMKNHPDLYIEIRKDNYINVYYQGGSVVRLDYCSKHKKIQAFTHPKYLGGKGKTYVNCIDILDEKFDSILENIRTHYSQKKGISKEKWSETYIKGHIITKRPNHLDSEFAYTDEGRDIQIDLIECVNGVIRFVELKRIGDNRMLNKDNTTPEVVDQIEKYSKFIKKYKNELVAYYQKIWDIKHDILKLPNLPLRPVDIDTKPLLLIFNNWTTTSTRKEKHTRDMEEILKRKNVNYIIESEI